MNSVQESRANLAWQVVLSVAIVATALGTNAVFGDEVQVTASPIVDYEFDQQDALLTYVDLSHRLWTAGVDRNTGAFVPPTGHGTLVDVDAATSPDFGNGPEWVEGSTGGYQIIYTKYLTGQPQSAATANIAKVVYQSGAWYPSFLPNTLGFVEPIGNINPTQANPPVVFRNGSSGDWQLYTQGINDSTPLAVPNTSQSKGSERFVPGLNELVYTTPVGVGRSSWRQVFSYDLNTGATTQLTSDSGNKGDVFLWQAPEYGGAYVAMVSVNAQSLRFYTPQYNAKTQTNAWTVVATIPIPSGAPAYIWSPEPFVYKGKSYVFMVRSPNGNPSLFSYPTQVWLASLDNTYNVQISDPTITDRVRQDPEVFITSQGPFIYYNRYTRNSPGAPSRAEGVWRSNSGLGP